MKQSNINLRANIMYFIEHLCDLAHREGHHAYISNIEKDMSRIIELVAPSNRAGATNIKVIRRVRSSTPRVVQQDC
jgi:CTD kinase subunit gamma